MKLPYWLLTPVALAVSLLLAWWPWRGKLSSLSARIGVLARALAIVALFLLIFDPGIRSRLAKVTPLVLLDNSVSMYAAGGSADSAVATAAAIGEVHTFDGLTDSLPGGQSHLRDDLEAAVALGRPITVVTDGEISDAEQIPADILAQSELVVMPRKVAANVGITAVQMPQRIASGDTLTIETTVQASGGWQDSVMVEVRTGDVLLLSKAVGFLTADQAVRVRLKGLLPTTLSGHRWLDVSLANITDAESDDNLRLRELMVTTSPGIVVIAENPDWDSRYLYNVLTSVTQSAVRGFVQITPGLWRRMDDLTPVAIGVVVQAARDADLLAVRGDTAAWQGLGKSRFFWPLGTEDGDWYLNPGSLSPLSGIFSGLHVDSLPPASAIAPLPEAAWTAVVAQRARRGEFVPVMTGSESRGRAVVLGAEGLFRWGLRGGTAEQAWRTLLAESATWLLDAPIIDGAPAKPIQAVTQRGMPVRFKSSEASITDVPIAVTGDERTLEDTLRFDANGVAQLALAPGKYSYTFPEGQAGSFAVERFSDELIPSPVTLSSRPAEVIPSPPRRSLRDILPLFLVAVFGFSLEWILRRKLGLH